MCWAGVNKASSAETSLTEIKSQPETILEKITKDFLVLLNRGSSITIVIN